MSLHRTLQVTGAAALILAGGLAQAQYSTPMRDVENPDRFPYQESAFASLATPFVNGFLLFPTPAGKRYVIEYVAVTCTTPSAFDTFPQVLLTTTKITSPTSTTGINVNAVAMERRGASFFGGYVWSGAAQLKMYSDYDPFTVGGGTGISINLFHTDTTVAPTCRATVTGHTITP
jgi:hypothetical protein